LVEKRGFSTNVLHFEDLHFQLLILKDQLMDQEALLHLEYLNMQPLQLVHLLNYRTRRKGGWGMAKLGSPRVKARSNSQEH